MNRLLNERIGLIAFFAVLLVFLGWAAVLLAPFFGPLLCALSVSILLEPLHTWMARHFPKISKNMRALILTLATLFLLVGPLVAVSISLSNEASELLPGLKDQFLAFKAELDSSSVTLPGWMHVLPASIGDRIRDVLNHSEEKLIALSHSAARTAAESAAKIAVNALVLAANTLLFEFVLFFLLRDGDKFFKRWNELLPFPHEMKQRIHRRIASVIQGVVRGIVVIGLVQTVIMTAAYLIVGVRSVFLLICLTGLSTLVPGIGLGLVWVPLALVYFLKGVLWKGITLAIFGLVSGTVDNIIRPWVTGPKMELSPLWLLLAVLGGLQYFGPLGILIGPLIFSILPILLDAYHVYIQETP